MESHKKLLLANKAWVQEKLRVRANFFEEHAESHNPEYLWIGCADARVPAEEVTGTEPGELFVHRNIANLVIHTDFNLMSVLQYAVEVLVVKHIIVCGHYGCGGVRNAISHQDLGLINKWLRHIKDVYRLNSRELETIAEPERRMDRLVELNVAEQVQHVVETSIVQHAWKNRGGPNVHGWVYDLRTGYLKEVAMMAAGSDVGAIYRYDFPPES